MTSHEGVNDERLGALLADGRQLLDRVDAEELDPRTVNDAYQLWYTRALDAVERLLPRRLEEFEGYYRASGRAEARARVISDVLANPPSPAERGAGLSEIFDPATPRRTFLHLFAYQLAILASADAPPAPRFDAARAEEAGKAELGVARRLLDAGHRRSAGVLAGALLRQQLSRLAAANGLPNIGTLSGVQLVDALGARGVIDADRWRALRPLAESAERCFAAGARRPTHKDVKRLLGGLTDVFTQLR